MIPCFCVSKFDLGLQNVIYRVRLAMAMGKDPMTRQEL
jgi:hypothetical protein